MIIHFGGIQAFGRIPQHWGVFKTNESFNPHKIYESNHKFIRSIKIVNISNENLEIHFWVSGWHIIPFNPFWTLIKLVKKWSKYLRIKMFNDFRALWLHGIHFKSSGSQGHYIRVIMRFGSIFSRRVWKIGCFVGVCSIECVYHNKNIQYVYC